MFTEDLHTQICSSRVIAVLVVDENKHAVPLAKALLAGGVKAMELTLRTPAALDALRAIREEVPGILAGVGTILTPRQVDEAKEAGAQFGVAPGMNPRVVQYAQDVGLPFGPGIMTPSDIEQAVELGCKTLKFFPAESSGGLKALAGMAAPYRHLGLDFIPLGGLNESNMGSYLASPLIAAIGGSWIAKREVIQAEDWAGIEETARQAMEIASQVQ